MKWLMTLSILVLLIVGARAAILGPMGTPAPEALAAPPAPPTTSPRSASENPHLAQMRRTEACFTKVDLNAYLSTETMGDFIAFVRCLKQAEAENAAENAPREHARAAREAAAVARVEALRQQQGRQEAAEQAAATTALRRQRMEHEKAALDAIRRQHTGRLP